MAFKGSPVLFYDVGVWGKLGFGVPNWGKRMTSANMVILELVEVLGRNLQAMMLHPDALSRIAISCSRSLSSSTRRSLACSLRICYLVGFLRSRSSRSRMPRSIDLSASSCSRKASSRFQEFSLASFWEATRACYWLPRVSPPGHAAGC